MKVGLLKKISLALGFVLWVTGSVCDRLLMKKVLTRLITIW